MARFPDWYDRLPDIQATLRESSAETLGKTDIQELFAAGERDSLRLLRRFGAQRAGDALAIPRTALLNHLEAVAASAAYQGYRRSRDRVAGEMAVSRPAAQARFRRISGSVEFVAGNTVAQLPDGITLERGRLEVRFGTEEDLWWLLDQLADSAAQDAEAFRERVDPAGGPKVR